MRASICPVLNKIVVLIFFLLNFNLTNSQSLNYVLNQNAASQIEDVVLIGIDHPYYPLDNKTFSKIADSLIYKSSFIQNKKTFSSGQDLINKLIVITQNCDAIGNLVILGHSGYQGYFVKYNAGFYRDEYEFYHHNGKVIPLDKMASRVSDLRRAVAERKIVFSDTSIIVLAGCNTAFGEDNIALDVMLATNVPVIGSNQRVDLFHGLNFGEDMLGVEQKTFYAYIPDGDSIIKYDLCHPSITITEAIKIVKKKQELLELSKVPLVYRMF